MTENMSRHDDDYLLFLLFAQFAAQKLCYPYSIASKCYGSLQSLHIREYQRCHHHLLRTNGTRSRARARIADVLCTLYKFNIFKMTCKSNWLLLDPIPFSWKLVFFTSYAIISLAVHQRKPNTHNLYWIHGALRREIIIKLRKWSLRLCWCLIKL